MNKIEIEFKKDRVIFFVDVGKGTSKEKAEKRAKKLFEKFGLQYNK